MKIHACETCGHEIKHQGELDGPIVHRPDGRHEWSVRISLGSRRGFGGDGSK